MGSFTLNLGVRYELPGNNIQSLIDLNEQILQANNNNAVFRLNPVPKSDRNNIQPRLGFNWQPVTDSSGLIGRRSSSGRWRARSRQAPTAPA